MERPVKHKYFDPNITRKGEVLRRHLEESNEDTSAPPFFSLIEFNLSGLCNRKCVFCPRSDPSVYPNVNEHISLDLYEKIMRELAEVDGVITSIDWTPDGTHIVYTVGRSGEAWRIPVEGGKAQKLDLKMHTDHIRFHPHGREIAFVGKREPDKRDIWVLENFLSPSASDKTKSK